MNWRDRITVDPRVCHGRVCIRGARVFASLVLDNLAARLDEAQIIASYPSLTGEDVKAAIAHAAEQARERTTELHAA